MGESHENVLGAFKIDACIHMLKSEHDPHNATRVSALHTPTPRPSQYGFIFRRELAVSRASIVCQQSLKMISIVKSVVRV